MLAEMLQIWQAFLILVFLGLAFLLAVTFTAVWTTRVISKRQELTESKWQELVEILIHNAREHGGIPGGQH